VELFVLDASFDALFDAGLIATVGKHGLAEQPLRAARADPAVSEEEDGAVSENEDGAGACVVGPGRPRSATKRARKTPKKLGDLTSFEEGLTLYIMRADNRFKCSEAKAHGKVSDLRRSVGRAQGIIRKSHFDATAPVSATDLAALRNTDRVLADLETVSSDRAKKLLGTILCALIFNKNSPDTVELVADESAVGLLRTWQDVIDFYTRHHRDAKNAVTNSNKPSMAQTKGWAPWPQLAAKTVELANQVKLDIEARGHGKVTAAELERLLALGILCMSVLHMPARLFELTSMWLAKTGPKDPDYAEKNWVHYTPGTPGVAPTFGIVYMVHKSSEAGALGVVTTSPIEACFKPFRDLFELYVRQLRKLTELAEDTSIPLFFNMKAYVKENILCPMNEDQLARVFESVSQRYLGKRIVCKMFRTIYSSYHALGLDPNATGEYPARDLTIEQVARAMLHTYNVHMTYYIVAVPN
jgi:hypothetical protein